MKTDELEAILSNNPGKKIVMSEGMHDVKIDEVWATDTEVRISVISTPPQLEEPNNVDILAGKMVELLKKKIPIDEILISYNHEDADLVGEAFVEAQSRME